MPWDASLNRDSHKTVRKHYVLSRATLKRQGKSSKDDERHVSMATPELAANSYKHILHPVTGISPTSKRILEDISGIWLAMYIIHDAKGVYVPGLAKRSGWRYMWGPKINRIHGGPRTKNVRSLAYEKRKTGLHDDLKTIRAVERKMREDGRIMSGNNFIQEIVQFVDVPHPATAPPVATATPVAEATPPVVPLVAEVMPGQGDSAEGTV